MSDKPVLFTIAALDSLAGLSMLLIFCLAVHEVWEGLCDDISVPLAV